MDTEKVVKTEAEWRALLTPEEFRVTRHAGTERAFTGRFDTDDSPTRYHCVCCGQPLFDAPTKFHSGCGWPSFFGFIDGAVWDRADHSHGMIRVEVLCTRCDAHLGHVFEDGPPPSGLRYCINSVCMVEDPELAAVNRTPGDVAPG